MPKKRRMSPRPRKEIDTSTYSGRFAARLRELRDKTGMSADEFAATHGFPSTTVYDWEIGRRTPSLEKFPEIAKALGVSVRNLIPKE